MTACVSATGRPYARCRLDWARSTPKGVPSLNIDDRLELGRERARAQRERGVPFLCALGTDRWIEQGYIQPPEFDMLASIAAVALVSDLPGDPLQYRATIGHPIEAATYGEPGEWSYDRITYKVISVEVICDWESSLTAQRIRDSRIGEAIQSARRAFTAYHYQLPAPSTRSEARRFNQAVEFLFADTPPEGDTWRVAKAWYEWDRAGRPSPMRRWIAERLGWGTDDRALNTVKHRMAAATRSGWIPPAGTMGSKLRPTEPGRRPD